jgi:hypothetical protein
VKLVHLVGFIIKKFVTMHGHTKVKYTTFLFSVFNNISTRIKKPTCRETGTSKIAFDGDSLSTVEVLNLSVLQE